MLNRDMDTTGKDVVVAAGVKEAVKGLLPDPAVRLIQERRAERAFRRCPPDSKVMDLSMVSLIRDAALTDLQDADYLERELLPRLGLNDEQLPEFPKFLYPHTGKGLLHWQYPSQFSKYLVELSGQRIENYLEIGVRHGGTFVITVEYLNRFHPLRKAVAVDFEGTPGLVQYQRTRRGILLMAADTQTTGFEEWVRAAGPFDLVLIDGDHSAAGSGRDFDTVADHARIVVFHDIVSDVVPGVGEAWRDVRARHPGRYRFLEFTDQYPELAERGNSYLGIGMAVRNPPA